MTTPSFQSFSSWTLLADSNTENVFTPFFLQEPPEPALSSSASLLHAFLQLVFQINLVLRLLGLFDAQCTLDALHIGQWIHWLF